MLGLTSVQTLSFFITLVVLVISALRLRYNHLKRWLDSPRLIWSLGLMVHFAVFYAAMMLYRCDRLVLSTTALNFWSSVIRLQSILTFLMIEVVEIYYHWKADKDG